MLRLFHCLGSEVLHGLVAEPRCQRWVRVCRLHQSTGQGHHSTPQLRARRGATDRAGASPSLLGSCSKERRTLISWGLQKHLPGDATLRVKGEARLFDPAFGTAQEPSSAPLRNPHQRRTATPSQVQGLFLSHKPSCGCDSGNSFYGKPRFPRSP